MLLDPTFYQPVLNFSHCLKKKQDLLQKFDLTLFIASRCPKVLGQVSWKFCSRTNLLIRSGEKRISMCLRIFYYFGIAQIIHTRCTIRGSGTGPTLFGELWWTRETKSAIAICLNNNSRKLDGKLPAVFWLPICNLFQNEMATEQETAGNCKFFLTLSLKLYAVHPALFLW